MVKRYPSESGVVTESRDRRGFTLIEVMMTVVIIGVLIGMVLAISGYVSAQADRKKAVADMEKIKLGLEEFRIRANTYPGGLTNNVMDPWGREYRYRLDEKYRYSLWSKGPDGLDDTKDDVNVSKGDI